MCAPISDGFQSRFTGCQIFFLYLWGISRSNKIGAVRTWTPDGVHVRCSPIFSLGLSVTLNLLCRN